MSLFSHLSTHFWFELFIWQQLWLQVLQISEETLLPRQFQKSTNTEMSGLYFQRRDNLNLLQGRRKSGVVSEKKGTQIKLICCYRLTESNNSETEDGFLHLAPPPKKKLHLLPLVAFHVLLIPSFAAIILRRGPFGELGLLRLCIKSVPQVWSARINTPVSVISMKTAGVSHGRL